MHETLLNKYMKVVHSVYKEPYEPVIVETFDDKHEKEMMQVTEVIGASVAGACGVVPKSGNMHMDIRKFLIREDDGASTSRSKVTCSF